MRKLEVCYTPALIHLFSVENTTTVIVDIFRATSCMVTGLAEGIPKIAPVEKIEETIPFAAQGYLRAGERNGVKVEAFDLGNSPLEYKKAANLHRNVVTTTTNGTRSIKAAANAQEIIIGSFLNLDAIVDYLLKVSDKNLLILCAGWKGRYNIEDSLFAGNLVDKLNESGRFEIQCDSAIAAQSLYQHYGGDMMQIISKASHMRRLGNLAAGNDIEFCLQKSIYGNVPIFDGQHLVNF